MSLLGSFCSKCGFSICRTGLSVKCPSDIHQRKSTRSDLWNTIAVLADPFRSVLPWKNMARTLLHVVKTKRNLNRYCESIQTISSWFFTLGSSIAPQHDMAKEKSLVWKGSGAPPTKYDKKVSERVAITYQVPSSENKRSFLFSCGS